MDTKNEVNVLMSDPYKANNLKIEETSEAHADIGPSWEASCFRWSYIEIYYSLVDDRINEGLLCTDYESQEITYGKCLEDGMQARLLKWYGCLPPWFPSATKENTCNASMTRQANSTMDSKLVSTRGVRRNINAIVGNTELVSSCLRPCKQLLINMKETASAYNYINNASLRLTNKGTVSVSTGVFEYTINR